MHTTISFTRDIYTTTFIAANYYSSDWYFEYVYMQLSTIWSFRHYFPVGWML